MTDRELLEMAARAAGMPRGEYCEPNHEPSLYHSDYGFWQPLADDGDALRLAVKLGIHLSNSGTDAWATTLAVTVTQSIGSDPYAATRRAIVRAAAAIGSKHE